MNRKRTRELIASVSLLALVLCTLFFPVVFGTRTLLSASRGTASITAQGAYQAKEVVWAYPRRSGDPGAVAWFPEPYYAFTHNQIVREHAPPLWNPYNGCGVPFLANMQSQVLNPIQAAAWLHPSPRAADMYILGRLLLAGTLTYCFLRLLYTFAPALLGAVAYMLTGYMVIFIGMPDISVCAFIPGLFWRLECLYRRGAKFMDVALLSLFTTLVVVGGMPEVSFLALLFGSLYYSLRVWWHGGNSFASTARRLAPLAWAYGLGAALAAPQIIPFLEYMSESSNAHAVAGTSQPGLTAAPLLNIVNYVAPLAFGPLGAPGLVAAPERIWLSGYFGASVLFLAMTGVCAAFRQGWHRTGNAAKLLAAFSAASAMFFMSMRFGIPPLQWVGSLPVFKMIVFWKYGEPLLGFFIATLASTGLASIGRRQLTAKQLCLTFAALTLGLAALPALALSQVSSPRLFLQCLGGSFAFALTTFVICLIAARWPRRYGRLAPLAVAVVLAELCFNFAVPTFYKFSPLPPRQDNPYTGAPFVQFLQKATEDRSRVIGYDGVLYPNWSSPFGIADVRDQDAMYPARFLPFLRAVGYGDANPKLPFADHNLTTRYDGEEAILDPIESSRTATILKLWQLTSTKYILGMVSHSVPPPTAEMRRMITLGERADWEHLHLAAISCGGTSRSCIFQHPLERERNILRYRLKVSKTMPWLFLRLGLDDAAVRRGITDGVTFTLTVEHAATNTTILHRSLAPVTNPSDRGWIPVWLDLRQFADENVIFQFSTDPGPGKDSRDDRAAWADIQFLPDDKQSPTVRAALDLPRVYHQEVDIFQVPNPLPRAAFYPGVAVAPNPDTALKRIMSAGFDPWREAVIEADDKALAGTSTTPREPAANSSPAIPATIDQYRSSYVRIQVNAPGKGLLVLNDTYYPGWQCQIDGHPTAIAHANYLFRGVLIQPGAHTVVFRYRPGSFITGVAAALLAVLALLGWGLWSKTAGGNPGKGTREQLRSTQ